MMIRKRFALVLTVATCIAGCDMFDPMMPNGGGTPPQTVGHNFGTATSLTLDASGSATITGTTSGDQADVYDLGPCEPGDRIIVSIDAAVGSQLDPTTAVFDGSGQLFALNDDEDLAAGLLGSRIDETVWIAGDNYYLAIAKFAFDTTGGSYQGSVQIVGGGAVTQPAVQYLLLDFSGGTVTIASEGTLAVDPFDAGDVDAAYAGRTTEIKAGIVQTVRDGFAGTGLQVITSDDTDPPPASFSTIYFGAFSATKFGVSESVDQGNRDCCDDGIVFTDNFDKPFAHQPSVSGIAIAIGNVAAHEAGHLLGLSHVADVTALMDSTGTASTLLADQEFKTALLATTIFPIGKQNAPLILQRVVPVSP